MSFFVVKGVGQGEKQFFRDYCEDLGGALLLLGGAAASRPCVDGEAAVPPHVRNLRLPDLGGNWNGTFYAVSQRYRPAAEYQPGYDGLPVGGTRVPPNTRSCESQGEWRSHSSGRRVVAASVLVSRRLAHDAGSRMKKCQVTFRKTPSKPARGQEV